MNLPQELNLHPILRELIDGGVPVTITSSCFLLHGFYQDVWLKLYPDRNDYSHAFRAVGPHGSIGGVDNLLDVVKLNYETWKRCRQQCGNAGWTSPDPAWVQLLTEHGFIAAKETTIYAPRVSRNR